MSATDPKSEGEAAELNPEDKPEPTVAVPRPEAKVAGPKPDAKAVELTKSDSKAADSTPKAPATDPKPDAKAAEPAKPGTVANKAKPEIRNKVIIAASIMGVLAGLVAAYLFGVERKAQPPVFAPVSSPYDSAIYSNGIVESDQPNGSNVYIYPEVPGPITHVLVHEGQNVPAGTPLFTIDDSVQRPATQQLLFQSEAALALLNELRAEPRPEALAVAGSQVGQAEANLKAARDQYDKDRASYDIDPKSISKDALDTAEDAVKQAEAGLEVARKQFELTKAGAWSYDIANQEKTYKALHQAYEAAKALLQKYSVKAPIDGIVLSVYAATGSYASSQGAYNPYTEGFDALVIMGPPQDYLSVRCYVDEILISRLPSPFHMVAQMSITGTDIKIPLEFVRVQPYVSPKIELSNERQEKVDLRVLPVIFRFQKKDAPVYPGQLVDVYIGQQK